MSELPKLATTYEVVPNKYPVVDGEPFPWLVAAEPGPMIQDYGADAPIHILWMPILIDTPMPHPPEGRPDAQPIPQEDQFPEAPPIPDDFDPFNGGIQ